MATHLFEHALHILPLELLDRGCEGLELVAPQHHGRHLAAHLSGNENHPVFAPIHSWRTPLSARARILASMKSG